MENTANLKQIRINQYDTKFTLENITNNNHDVKLTYLNKI